MNPKTFALKYVDVVTESLEVKARNGKIHCKVNEETMSDLSSSLGALIESQGLQIIKKCRQRSFDSGRAILYGRDPTDDIKSFVDMSALYLDEIFLKDIIYRIVKNRMKFPNINLVRLELENFSRQMYELRPLIEMGFVKIIPHLTMCDPEAIRFTKRYFPNNSLSIEELSVPYLYFDDIDMITKVIFWNAFYACAKLNCVPYTTSPKEWETTKTTLKTLSLNLESVLKGLSMGKADTLELIELIKEHQSHIKYMEILKALSGKLWYLKGVSTEELLKTRNNSPFSGFRKDLWKLIDEIVESKGFEVNEIIQNLEDQIISGVKEIDKERRKKSGKVRTTSTAIQFLVSGFTACYGLFYEQAGGIPLLISLLSMGTGSVNLLVELLEKRERNAVFVYFSRLKESTKQSEETKINSLLSCV